MSKPINRLRRRAGGSQLEATVAELTARVADLELAAMDSRQLSQRLNDALDVITELLVPAIDRDDERLNQALAGLKKFDDETPTR